MSTEEAGVEEVLEDQAPELEPEPEEKNPEPVEEFDTPADEVKVVEPTGKLQATVVIERLVYRARSKNSMSVRVLQALLETQGYPVGDDKRGWLSDGTRDALIAYQADAGLPVTGLADESTVSALFATSTRYERVL